MRCLAYFLLACVVQGNTVEDKTEDRSFQSLCFPQEVRDAALARRSSIIFGQLSRRGSRQIRIEIRSWDSHEITTRIAEILLREQLGLDVRVVLFEPHDRFYGSGTATEVYWRLSRGVSGFNGADLNFELWPEEPGPKAARQEALQGNARYASLTNYVGRNSWFIPVQSIDKSTTLWAKLNESMHVVEDVAAGYDEWRGFFPLYHFSTLHESMLTASLLPDATPTCDLLSDEAYASARGENGGRYDCARGTWYPTDGRCCPRHDVDCIGLPCRVLLVNKPTYAPNRNELAVNSSGMPLQILYVEDFETVQRFLNVSIQAKQPVILQWWEPSWMITPDQFIRFDMTPHFYCENGGEQSNTLLPDTPTCDFPGQSLEKMGNAELSDAEPTAWIMAQRLRVDFESIYRLSARTLSSTWTPFHDTQRVREENPHLSNNSILYWQSACDFLRLEQASCDSTDKSCYKHWLETTQEVSFELMDTLFFIATACLAVAIATAILRGDDGYTTGYAGLSPVDFVYNIWDKISKRTTRTRLVVSNAISAEHSRRVRASFQTGLRRGSSHLFNAEEFSAASQKALKPCCISFGRTKIIVSNKATFVSVPVLRVGESKEKITVRIESVDGMVGVPAKYGREYGTMTSPLEIQADLVADPRVVTLEFSTRTRVGFIYVELLNPTGVVTEYNGFANFHLKLVEASHDDVMLGPLNEVNVEIVDVGAFPDEASSETLKSLSELKTKDGTMKRPASVRDLFSDTNIYSKSTADVKANLSARLALVFGFLRRVTRVNGVRKKVVKHQIVSFFIAAHDNFLVPYMYKQIISYGVDGRRMDISLSIALFMLALYFTKYYIRLNFFHGSFLIVQHLRSLLCRKYLSLSMEDRALHFIDESALQEAYRVAFVFTCEEIRENCYKSVFHHGLPNFYGVVFSIAYIGYTISIGRSQGDVGEESMYAVIATTVLLLLVVSLWYSVRARISVLIWRAELILSRKYETELQHVLSDWRTIRDTWSAQAESSKMIGTYWKYIREGQYRMWYHRFYTTWTYEHCRTFFYYVLWALAPFFTSSAEFVPLIQVIQSLGSSAQQLAENFLNLLVSSQQVGEVAALLNESGEIVRRANKEVLSSEDVTRHANFSMQMDKLLHGSESKVWDFLHKSDKSSRKTIDDANDLNARTSTLQLAHAVSSGELVTLQTEAFDEVVNLFKSWSRLLSSDGWAGYLLVRDVYLKLPEPVGSLFKSFCIGDLLSTKPAIKTNVERRSFHKIPRAFNPSGEPMELDICTHLPADHVIGLRSLTDDSCSRTAQRVLLGMWHGRFHPEHGSCHCLLISDLIADSEISLPASKSLIDNLLFVRGRRFFDIDGKTRKEGAPIEPVCQRFMYQLCKLAGVSERVIGAEPTIKWATGETMTSPLLDKEDVIKLLLVRSALARPDALLIDRICEGFAPATQRCMFDFMHAYKNGEFEQLYAEMVGLGSVDGPMHSRTVVVSANDQCLCLGLRSEDPVLTLLSSSEAIISTKQRSLPEAAEIMDGWMQEHAVPTSEITITLRGSPARLGTSHNSEIETETEVSAS